MTPRIQVENIGKCYSVGNKKVMAKWGLSRIFSAVKMKAAYDETLLKNIWALREVSFEAAGGEVLGIIGPNGAGKTTLLKILARITFPTEGRAVVRGRVISLLEMGLGFQPDLSAKENIYLNAAIYGIGRREVEKKMEEIIRFAELEKFADRLPLKHYSSGMYLRLAFSVSINLEPDVLLADEVLAVGDIAFQEKCIDRMREIGKNGTTVLFVSHDMDAIERLCDRCIRLQEGRIADEGLPPDVTARYQDEVWTVSAKNRRDKRGMHVNEFGEILAVELADSEKKKIGVVKKSEDFFVRIVFGVSQARVHVRCGFEAHVRNTTVFRSHHPLDVFVADPGIYEVYCRMPKGFLLDISYWINAFVAFVEKEGLPVNKRVIDYNALSFRVYDVEKIQNPTRPFMKTRAYGFVTPALEWEGVRAAAAEPLFKEGAAA